MKKLLATTATFILLQQAPVQLFAQSAVSKEVPQSVTAAFAEKFPEGNVKKWKTQKEGYIVQFKKDGKKYYAYYSPEGHWKATESPVKWTRHLPEAVKMAWKYSGYAGWYVHNIRKIETSERQLYVLHLNNGSLLDSNHYDAYKEDHVLYFTREGELVNAERI